MEGLRAQLPDGVGVGGAAATAPPARPPVPAADRAPRGVRRLVPIVVPLLALGAVVGVGVGWALGGRGGAPTAPSDISLDLPAPGSLPADRTFADAAGASDERVHAGSVQRVAGATVLEGVSVLGGAVTAARMVIPDQGAAGAAVSGLRVDGAARPSGPDDISALGDRGYVVALQEAAVGGRSVLVGLRIHLYGEGPGGAGRDLLVGTPSAPGGTGAAGPASLAFPTDASAGQGGQVDPAPGYGYPLAVRGTIIGCPFIPGSSHSPFAWPHNLASDNAVDIGVPIGTPVLAVADGVIGSEIGPLDSTLPRMAGLRVHLNTPTVRFYYAHLSRIDVTPGQHVVRGQQIGRSGEAAGVAHLHFAEDVGDPAVTVGQAQACPAYHFYPEPWG